MRVQRKWTRAQQPSLGYKRTTCVVDRCSDGLAAATDIRLPEDENLYLEEPYEARSVFEHA